MNRATEAIRLSYTTANSKLCKKYNAYIYVEMLFAHQVSHMRVSQLDTVCRQHMPCLTTYHYTVLYRQCTVCTVRAVVLTHFNGSVPGCISMARATVMSAH